MASKALRNYLARIGKRGGKASSPAKIEASRANAKKAHAALKAKRERTVPAIVGNGGAVE